MVVPAAQPDAADGTNRPQPSELDTCATDAGCAALGAKLHPHTPSTLVAHVVVMGGLAPSWRGGNQPTTRRNLVEARAEGRPCD
jgi:hypothetical protein